MSDRISRMRRRLRMDVTLSTFGHLLNGSDSAV